MLLLFFISQSVAQCMIQQTLRGLRCIIVTATQGVCVDSQCDAGIGVPHARGDGHGIDVICQQYGGVCVPLRYNKDKREKPVFSRGLSVCRSHFNSFSNIETDAKI